MEAKLQKHKTREHVHFCAVIVSNYYCNPSGPATVPANSIVPTTFYTAVNYQTLYTCVPGYSLGPAGAPMAGCNAFNATTGSWSLGLLTMASVFVFKFDGLNLKSALLFSN